MNEKWYVAKASENDTNLVFVFKLGEYLTPEVRNAMGFVKEEPNGTVYVRMGMDDGSVYIVKDAPASLLNELEQNRITVLPDKSLVKRWIEKNVWMYLRINLDTVCLAAKFDSTGQWVTSVDVKNFVFEEMGIQ